MSVTLYVVDSFTDKPFAGNPAGVCLLEAAADDTWMRLVAREMNHAETAFLYPVEGGYSLRWFTPAAEVKLCGHATLATAFMLWETGVLAKDTVARFTTLSGWLTCRRDQDWIEMDFPANVARQCTEPEGMSQSLGAPLEWVGNSGMDYLVQVANETVLRSLKPNMSELIKLPVRGVIVTSKSDSKQYDFVSRFFAPAVGVNEDPVTGSAHCTLGPYWAEKLGRTELVGYQASERGGTVKLAVRGERVLLRGQAVMMSRVEMVGA
jgi:PhzF family phenazine biosynthesis protein